MAETLADRVNALAATHGAEFSRTPASDGTVAVRLTLPSGDVVTGTGATTANAVAMLETRVALLYPTPEA